MIARRAPYKKSNETKKAEFVLKSDDISLFSLCDKTNENIPGTEESESETSVLMDDDAFVRNTVTRKSMSEKRPLGAHSDPSHLQTYQRIKHFRQTSAPALACGIEMLRSKFTPGGCKTNEKNSFHRRSIGAANRRLSFADQHMMSRDKFSITASKPHVYESKTLPLKLKMNGDPCKKISRFFDFFKQSSTSTQAFKSYVTNCNNSDNETRLIEQEPSSLYKKELGEKYASPGRRSVSFDQFGFESAGTGSRESRLATSLDQIKTRESKRANTNNATAVTKMITSVSQPALRTKGTDSETCKLSLPKEKSLTCTAIVEKRNRRKSTGSSLLKLFQKSSPTAASQLYAEDEKAAAKYTILLEEQKKLNVMDDAFRRETLNRQVNTAYLSSSRSEPRAPPPSYHQFVQHGYSAPPSLPSQFFPFKQCNSLQSPQVTAYGIAPIKHRRGHSAHELPNDSFICQKPSECSRHYERHCYAAERVPYANASSGVLVQPYAITVGYNLPSPSPYEQGLHLSSRKQIRSSTSMEYTRGFGNNEASLPVYAYSPTPSIIARLATLQRDHYYDSFNAWFASSESAVPSQSSAMAGIPQHHNNKQSRQRTTNTETLANSIGLNNDVGELQESIGRIQSNPNFMQQQQLLPHEESSTFLSAKTRSMGIFSGSCFYTSPLSSMRVDRNKYLYEFDEFGHVIKPTLQSKSPTKYHYRSAHNEKKSGEYKNERLGDSVIQNERRNEAPKTKYVSPAYDALQPISLLNRL